MLANKYEVRAIYRTIIKEIKWTIPRKLEWESKLKEFWFIFDMSKDCNDLKEIDERKLEMYEIIKRI